MLLSSSLYFVFLVAVFFLYWPVARVRALSLGVLLFANYFFYAKWDLFYLWLIPAASTSAGTWVTWRPVAARTKIPASRAAPIAADVRALIVLSSRSRVPSRSDAISRIR